MFRSRRQRYERNQPPPNPISDMEQFYLNQYFRSNPGESGPYPFGHPYQSNDRFPPIEFARLHQLELRIARIEQYLGLTTTESSSKPIIG